MAAEVAPLAETAEGKLLIPLLDDLLADAGGDELALARAAGKALPYARAAFYVANGRYDYGIPKLAQYGNHPDPQERGQQLGQPRPIMWMMHVEPHYDKLVIEAGGITDPLSGEPSRSWRLPLTGRRSR